MTLKTTLFSVALIGLGLQTFSSQAAAATNPPLVGTYRSLMGQVLPGRATESMPCDLCEGQIGNLIMAASWNGATLGTNWTLSCPQISSSPQLTYDGVVSGNGQRIYQTSYSGGVLMLDGSGAWGTGDPSYSGPISTFTVIVTKQYVGGVQVGAVSNINFFGVINGYDNCFNMAISNGELIGETGATLGPPSDAANYPAFMGPSDCGASGSHGAYWDIHDITFSILGQCAVPARPMTWGQMKSIYR